MPGSDHLPLQMTLDIDFNSVVNFIDNLCPRDKVSFNWSKCTGTLNELSQYQGGVGGSLNPPEFWMGGLNTCQPPPDFEKIFLGGGWPPLN